MAAKRKPVAQAALALPEPAAPGRSNASDRLRHCMCHVAHGERECYPGCGVEAYGEPRPSEEEFREAAAKMGKFWSSLGKTKRAP